MYTQVDVIQIYQKVPFRYDFEGKLYQMQKWREEGASLKKCIDMPKAMEKKEKQIFYYCKNGLFRLTVNIDKRFWYFLLGKEALFYAFS